MRILAIILALPAVLGFGVPRREAIKQSGVAFVVGIVAPELANAFSQQLDENIVEPAQQATGGKVDLNSAFVVSSISTDRQLRLYQLLTPPSAGRLHAVPRNVPQCRWKDCLERPIQVGKYANLMTAHFDR